MKHIYLIYSKAESEIQDEPMYWSNKYGWVSIDQADAFTEKDKKGFHLPAIDSEWVELKKHIT